MSIEFSDLRSLYRAAEREEQPTRADTRAVRTAILSAVQAALGSKDATRALQLLDAQDQAYRAGSLTQERSAARVIALCIAGHATEAQVAKDRFFNAYPGSPWLRRINATCTK